jgi:hypothetical protein
LTVERDRSREELHQGKVALATAEGALNEARQQLAQEQERNRELSERVIAETTRAKLLAEQLQRRPD